MPESITMHEQQITDPIAEAAQQEALQQAQGFLESEIPALQKVTGLAVDVQVGKGWATDMETGNFSVDPTFFTERGYSAEHSAYATLHELMAHVRDVKRDPVFAARQRAFGRRSEADHLFSNILTDIHGNKLMHRLLPRQADVASDLYDTKLFPLEKDGEPVDYTAKPLHVQFLYKMIRQEMVPGGATPVRPEVDEALAGLRNYKGSGQDVIAHLTKPDAKVSGSDRFDKQLATIYPVYRALLEQAKEEAEQQGGDSQADGQPGSSDGQPSEPNQNQPAKPGEKSDPFSAEYADYFEDKHPEPMSEEQEKQLDEMIRKAAKEQRDHTKAPDPKRELDQTLRRETGFGLREHQSYAAEVEKHKDAIDAMRDVYRSVIQERVARRRGLSRNVYADGDILNPNRLPQLIIDKKAGITEPEAFTRYEKIRGNTELVGKTDYLFVFDRSGSMQGDKSAAASASALIMLEALAGMERDIKETEEREGLDLDLDIRTALYTFNSEVACTKQLSSGLSDAERLVTYSQVKDAGGGNADSVVLHQIEAMPIEADRKQVLIVVSDGEADNVEASRASVLRLRQNGWHVFGVAIGSRAAEKLYEPYSRLIDDPSNLPDVLQSFIESTLQ
jgi:hypothetical protein